jgi:hypothetical protein
MIVIINSQFSYLRLIISLFWPRPRRAATIYILGPVEIIPVGIPDTGHHRRRRIPEAVPGVLNVVSGFPVKTVVSRTGNAVVGAHTYLSRSKRLGARKRTVTTVMTVLHSSRSSTSRVHKEIRDFTRNVPSTTQSSRLNRLVTRNEKKILFRYLLRRSVSIWYRTVWRVTIRIQKCFSGSILLLKSYLNDGSLKWNNTIRFTINLRRCPATKRHRSFSIYTIYSRYP